MTDYKDVIQEEIQSGRFIQAFERALCAYCESGIAEYQREKTRKKLLIQTLLAVGGIPWDEVEEETKVYDLFEELLDKNLSFSARGTLAACLLRLLIEEDVHWVSESRWRPRIIRYLEDTLQESVFAKDWRINTNGMGHEVLPAIQASAQDTVKQYRNAIDSLTSLDRILSVQQRLMAIINRASGQAIFSAFLPNNITAEISEAFSCVRAYLEKRDDSNVLTAYSAAKEQLELLINLTRSFGTQYSNVVATDFAGRLLTELENDFKSNRAAQPATVSLRPRDKKYPLHTTNTESSLGLLLHNEGPGYADNTCIQILLGNGVQLVSDSEEIHLGRIAPSVRQNIDVPFIVHQPRHAVTVYIEMSWRNFDNTVETKEIEFQIEGQRSNINWEKLEQSDPYSLEPVTTEEELIGRRDLLNRLVSTFDSQQVGSAVIKGQKRVGKTSIAKAVGSVLEKKGYLVVYLEGGDYVDPDAKRTVSRLGRRICRQLQRKEAKLNHVTPPPFDDSLSPLVDFLEDVEDLLPDRRIVFILDEFDELPIELYVRSDLGNAFFLTLRSISSRSNIGFLLVGGEKMDHIMSFQGAQLNKWRTVAVDYFSRERDWSDYKELIQRPVEGSIDYTENAFIHLYELSAGNPFFTNQICEYIFRNATEKRDCYVTSDEVQEGVQTALRYLSSNTFQHFWDDGLVESDAQAIFEKSIRRRKVLIAIAETIEDGNSVTHEFLKKQSILRDLAVIENDLREFVTRDILLKNKEEYEFKVELFSRWLLTRGINELVSTFPDLDPTLRNLQEAESLRVTAPEVVEVVEQWKLYKGQRITEDKIRTWLEQFGKPNRQRLMFKILQGTQFYSSTVVREKLLDATRIIREKTILRHQRGKRKRNDILVSYLDQPAKSGARFANIFADVADIYVDQVVEKGKLAAEIERQKEVQAVVFIDDFVGTGNSSIGYLQEIDKVLSTATQNREEKPIILFVAVVAHKEGWARLQRAAEKLTMKTYVHCCDLLDEQHQCFSKSSAIFTDDHEREDAKKLAVEFGTKLEKQHPLGYGDLELAIVFEDGCPNNSLPILWSESSGQFTWKPIFKRH